MKKRITACLLAFALAAGMTSCGKTSSSGSDSSDDLTKPKDMIQASSTVITKSETTTTAVTAAELADKESGGEETTTAKKKKKKKKTETKKSDGKKKETKKTEKKAEETKAEETKAEESEKTFTYENSVYSMEMSEDKWLSVTDYKKILKQSAKSSNGIYSVDDLDKIVGNIYFYNENSGSKQTVVVISNPIYQASISSYKLEDIYDQLLASIKPQFESQNAIKLLSDELVTHNGIKMMRLKAQGKRSGITIDCDEYVFLKNGNLCVIAVTTNDAEKGLAEFNKTLDTIKYK